MFSKAILGRLFFAISMVNLGIQQLLTASFVRLVPPLPAWVPSHSIWAYLAGIVLIVAGVAIATGKMARWAAAALGAMLLLSILFLHLPLAATNPLAGFMWTNPAKALAMLGGVIILAGVLPEEVRPSGIAGWFERLRPLGPLFLGGFMILGGIQHFVYVGFVTTLVPSWIPGPELWVYFTGVALIAGGMGILVPKTARLAATMSGIMMFLWVLLLHIPRALADTSNAGEVSGIYEALALSGAAFMLAGRGRAARSVSRLGDSPDAAPGIAPTPAAGGRRS